MMTIVLPIALAAFLVVRLAPIWSGRNRGCDAYYFIMAADAFRRRRRLPIRLPPLFLLEPEEQWYPPGFAMMLGLMPANWLRKYHWLLNQVFDGAVCAALVIWVASASGPVISLGAGLAYAFSAFVMMEYSTLTSRSVGAFLLFIFLLFSYLSLDSGPAWLFLSVLAGTALLYTHKLSVQLLWFVMPALALIERDPRWLLPLPLAYATAFAVGRRQFLNILRAHWDIVSFYRRNWPQLGAHLVRNSPVYGNRSNSVSYHRGGFWRSNGVHVRRVLQYNPWIVLLLAIKSSDLQPFEHFLFDLVIAIYVWAGLTLWLPALRCLGEGTKYIKFAIPPCLAIVFGQVLTSKEPLVVAMLLIAAVVQLFLYAIVARSLRQNTNQVGVLTPDLQSLLLEIEGMNNARILCLPPHLAELVAHETGKPVLWGGHGYGFRQLEAFHPVLRQPIAYFVERYGLTHLLLDKRYASLDDVRMPVRPMRESGTYVLYPLQTA